MISLYEKLIRMPVMFMCTVGMLKDLHLNIFYNYHVNANNKMCFTLLNLAPELIAKPL